MSIYKNFCVGFIFGTFHIINMDKKYIEDIIKIPIITTLEISFNSLFYECINVGLTKLMHKNIKMEKSKNIIMYALTICNICFIIKKMYENKYNNYNKP